jgi:thioredoxin 1
VTPVAAGPTSSEPLPKFLNFGADRCIPCKQMVPVREAIAAEYAGQVEVGFIDVWADREAGRAYHVRVIPTQLILDAEGRELFRHEGYWPKKQVLAQFAAVGIELRPAVNR